MSALQEDLVSLDALGDRGRDQVGGKALGLGRMIRAGARVPPGFVIPCAATLDLPSLRARIEARVAGLGVERLAVRSSATCEDGAHSSYAGMFETCLDVPPAGVLAAAELVKQSAARGEACRARMAIIVQAMVDADQSGVCFSVDPVADPAQILIEAVDGLGHRLVSGQLTPRRYRVERANLEIRAEPPRDHHRRPVAPRFLRELSELALAFEAATGAAVDLEWAISAGQLYLLQCRRITALSSRPTHARARYRYIWSTAEPMWMMEIGLRTRARLLPADFDAPTLWPFEDLLYIKQGETWEYHVNEREVSSFAPEPENIRSLLARAEARWLTQRHELEELTSLSWSSLDADALDSIFHAAQRFYAAHIGLYSASSSLVTRAFEAKLATLLHGEDYYTMLRAPEPDQMELEQSDWRELVSRGPLGREAALEHARRHPFIALGQLSEDAVVEMLQARSTSTPRCVSASLGGQTRAALRRRQAQLLDAHPSLRETVELIHRMSISRMRIKRGWAGLSFFLLPMFAELARRTGERAEDLQSLYRVDELHALIRGGPALDADTKARRRVACLWSVTDRALKHQDGPDALAASRARVGRPPTNTLFGDIASPGEARGVARVVHCNDPLSMASARARFETGDILVTEMVQPSMIDLVARAAGVITNEGGMLSHAAIVARELGVPCVVATRVATKLISDGERIVITARGSIER